MTEWRTLCRLGVVLAVGLLPSAIAPSSAFLLAADDPPPPPKSFSGKTLPQIRAAAEAAEKRGDWEVAFAAYCHLFVADRSAPELREKVNASLRRVQQLRRHRDPQFQKYVQSTSVSDALNLFAEVMGKVPALYVERDRSTVQLLWESGVEELGRALASPAFRQAFLSEITGEKPGEELEAFRKTLKSWAKLPVTDAKAARSAQRKLLTALQEACLVRTPSAVVLEMVCGLCAGLDEYTIFLTPTQQHTGSLSGSADFSAYGIYWTFTDGSLVVSGVAPGSWAHYHTQLRKGDKVVRLNHQSLEPATPASVAEAIRLVMGPVHVLEVAGATVETELPTTVPTVYAPNVFHFKDNIGYARIGSFNSNTARELDSMIGLLKSQQDVRGLIIDLRGNMGGSFMASVETAKRLIPNGLIVTTQGQLNEVANQPFSSDSGMTAHDLPVVVLINSETASAAEVLAAALKDNNRATLIGMPTFGKGAIQYPLKLVSLDEFDDQGKPRTNRSGTVRLTIAKLIAPSGSPINGVGISPHILEANPDRQLELAKEKVQELISSAMRPLSPPATVEP
jgi:C-terminal peptidase prc